jgi:HAD superfamily hydrolase (TIGR01450 family)
MSPTSDEMSDGQASGSAADPGAALAELYDVALLDLDGVVYQGDRPVVGATDALESAARLGQHRVFVTNNASRTPAVVADQLRRLGIPAGPDDIVTSAQAAAVALTRRVAPGGRVLVVGGDGLVEAVTEQGLEPVVTADDDPCAVVQGFAPTVTWQMLMEACVGLRAGLPWVVTNADATLPTPRGTGPGNGALVDLVRAVTHRDPDEIAGKPFAPIMAEAGRRRQARRPLVVGDRLDTDIEAARAAGMDSLLVLTGVTGVTDLLACPPHRRPTYVAATLAGLLAPPRVPCPVEGGWRCGAVEVRLDQPTGSGASLSLTVRIDGKPADAPPHAEQDDVETGADVVRAAVAARWSWPGGGAEVTQQVAALLLPWAASYGWGR